ncbi:MAG: SET domain-containing protein [Planctomycetota bacterium]|jgi:SET domain-containing protein
MAEHPGTRVIRSPIHGYGVVATRDFAPGEEIIEVDGILYHESDDFDDSYALMLDDGFLYDMVDQTRWINHSCDPNAEVDAELEGDGDAWACLIAVRPIRAGEEITYDYAFPASVAEPCSCGSPNCRGWIVDEDELPLLRELLKEKSLIGSQV